jgi:cytochrome c oxidase accessory protein FixG
LNDPIPRPGQIEPPAEITLYEVRRTIYPRAVHGWFAGWRVALVLLTQIIYYGGPWLAWNGRQAVLFNLVERKFYIFGLVFWPQDFILLTALLVISALSLFLFTAVAGRLWCGFACPQTVYTEIFMWIEHQIEGDRTARMKLDRAPLSARKVALKTAKHAVWIALSVWTGFTFVGYFTPIKTLLGEVAHLGLGPWETFWVLFYGFATYGNAGWMREQVCKYMCPYARFQSVMFDSDTLVITYDTQRGEPRGSRSRSTDPAKAGLGHCVDCDICVQVCPTGIDIRRGLQYECIGCAACIDGCNQVMDKMGYPRGLIRYSTENALRGKYAERDLLRYLSRPRVLIYSAVLLVLIGGVAAAVGLRVPMRMDVIRDRSSLAREAGPGVIENVYEIQIMNTDETARAFHLRVAGLPGIRLAGVEQPVTVEGAASRRIPVRVQVPLEGAGAEGLREHRGHEEHEEELKPGAHKISITAEAVDDPRITRREKSSFIVPR